MGQFLARWLCRSTRQLVLIKLFGSSSYCGLTTRVLTLPSRNKLVFADLPHRFRAFRPQYFLPLIVFGIFLNITATYGCILPTMPYVYSLSNVHHHV